jgi:hypothetical protein
MQVKKLHKSKNFILQRGGIKVLDERKKLLHIVICCLKYINMLCVL